MKIMYSPLHMRRGRWSPESPETEWPAFHPQTDDYPAMSGTVRENVIMQSSYRLLDQGRDCKSFAFVHQGLS